MFQNNIVTKIEDKNQRVSSQLTNALKNYNCNHTMLVLYNRRLGSSTLMDYETGSYMFDRRRNISGWDEIRKFKIEIKNTREMPVKVEIRRNFRTQYWEIETKQKYEKDDLDTIKFTLTLGPRSKKKFGYTVTTYHGEREREWVRRNR